MSCSHCRSSDGVKDVNLKVVYKQTNWLSNVFKKTTNNLADGNPVSLK